MSGLAVLSAIYGGWDDPKPAPTELGADEYLLVTDSDAVADRASALDWRAVRHDAPEGMHPCLSAKRPKFMPWLYTSCTQAIWLDASAEISDFDGFSGWLYGPGAGEINLYAHPERSDIAAELDASAQPKYDQVRQMMTDQVAHYCESSGGRILDAGLYATGLIGWRDLLAPDVMAVGQSWWRECCRWSFQDQLSLPWVLASFPLVKVRRLYGMQYDSARIIWHRHRGET